MLALDQNTSAFQSSQPVDRQRVAPLPITARKGDCPGIRLELAASPLAAAGGSGAPSERMGRLQGPSDQLRLRPLYSPAACAPLPRGPWLLPHSFRAAMVRCRSSGTRTGTTLNWTCGRPIMSLPSDTTSSPTRRGNFAEQRFHRHHGLDRCSDDRAGVAAKGSVTDCPSHTTSPRSRAMIGSFRRINPKWHLTEDKNFNDTGFHPRHSSRATTEADLSVDIENLIVADGQGSQRMGDHRAFYRRGELSGVHRKRSRTQDRV